MYSKAKQYKGGTNPKSFDAIVREVFAPIYPTIAEQIVTKTAKYEGYCLDVGCGTGALGRAMAKLTNLHISYFDQSPEMIEYAMDYAYKEQLMHRSDFLVGDVHQLRLYDNSMDLVISRGSFPFWRDWNKAYLEICRVLKPNGHAYIGGGFGNAKLHSEIVETMNKRKPNWKSPMKEKLSSERETLKEIVRELPVTQANIINDESGFWVHIIK